MAAEISRRAPDEDQSLDAVWAAQASITRQLNKLRKDFFRISTELRNEILDLKASISTVPRPGQPQPPPVGFRCKEHVNQENEKKNDTVYVRMDSTSAVHSNYSSFTLDLPPIYKPCHSRKSINRAPISLEKRPPSLKESRERSEIALASLLLFDHCRSSVEPPPDHHLRPGVLPYHHLRPGVLPDHHLRPDVLPDHHMRPDVLPDHHLRPDVLPENHLRPDVLPEHHLRPDVLPDHHLRPDVLPEHHLTPDALPDNHPRPDVLPDHHLRPDVLPDHHLRPDILTSYLRQTIT
ncbi:hypothetical protein M5K25_006373 [Dendrobium thyrsiflorum]|uniref:Uncharacterized protein n=1 Tax=Dendrobium thyrsiflorum TaxID=117978 RepID=A0ABD0VBQ3_DENTH